MRAMQMSYARPNAAVGQSGLQALYETMFRNYGIIVGQVLVTKSDFYNEETRTQLFSTLNELMALNIIPIINTNDAVSPPPQKDEDVSTFFILLNLLSFTQFYSIWIWKKKFFFVKLIYVFDYFRWVALLASRTMTA